MPSGSMCVYDVNKFFFLPIPLVQIVAASLESLYIPLEEHKIK